MPTTRRQLSPAQRRAAVVRRIGLRMAVLVLLVAPSAEGQVSIDVPKANLEGLEPAVAEQLESLLEFVAGRVEDQGATGPELAEAIGDLGRYYHAYALSDAADECYAIARRLAPEDFRWTYLAGYLFQSEGRLEEAVAQYERALQLVPEVPPALIRLGQVYLELDRAADAERVLLEALRLDPTASAAMAELGQLYLSAGRNAEAVEVLERALELSSEADLLYYPLGQAYRALGDMDKARASLARSGEVGVRPADPLVDGLAELTTGERVFLLRGRAAFSAGRFDEAVDEFRRAVEARPDSVRARINLAAALAQKGELDAAIAELEQVVEIAPGNSTALFNLGSLYEARGEREKAAESFAGAASYAPRDAGIRLRLGRSLRGLGRLEEALPHYTRAVALDASSEAGWLGEADVLARLGRFEESIGRLETAHQLMPDSAVIALALARFLAACPDPALRDGKRGLALVRPIAEAEPTLPNVQILAQSYAEAGLCSDAAEVQSRLVEQAREAGAADAAALLDVVRDRYAAGPPCRPPFRAPSQP